MQKYFIKDTINTSWPVKAVAALGAIIIHLQYLHIYQTLQKAGGSCSIHCTENVLVESQMNNTRCCVNINQHVRVIKSSVSEVTAW